MAGVQVGGHDHGDLVQVGAPVLHVGLEVRQIQTPDLRQDLEELLDDDRGNAFDLNLKRAERLITIDKIYMRTPYVNF